MNPGLGSSLIGVDVGGSFVKAGLVAAPGDLILRHQTEPTVNGPAVVAKVCQMIAALLARAPLEAPAAAIGISSCGVVDPTLGIILESVSIPDYPGTDWPAALAEFDLPVRVENDARAAAWAEFQMRDDPAVCDWIHVAVGTKVGCGIILNGRLQHGSSFSAGELGHVTVSLDGPACQCGNTGCLELYATDGTVIRHVLNGLAQGRVSVLSSAQEEIDLRAVSAAEKQGDALAHAAFAQMGRYLGVGLTTMVNLFNPSVVSVGGGTIEASDTILDAARGYVDRHALRSAREHLVIERGKLGNEAGIIGAALLAQERTLRTG